MAGGERNNTLKTPAQSRTCPVVEGRLEAAIADFGERIGDADEQRERGNDVTALQDGRC